MTRSRCGVYWDSDIKGWHGSLKSTCAGTEEPQEDETAVMLRATVSGWSVSSLVWVERDATMQGTDIWESKRCHFGSPTLCRQNETQSMSGTLFLSLRAKHVVGVTCYLTAGGAPGGSILGTPWRQLVASLRWHAWEPIMPSPEPPKKILLIAHSSSPYSGCGAGLSTFHVQSATVFITTPRPGPVIILFCTQVRKQTEVCYRTCSRCKLEWQRWDLNLVWLT